jgi:uncharacterized protein (TIGR02569 family)
VNASPPPSVLSAFDLDGAPARLPGGRGRAWRVGDAVLKPLDQEVEEVEWQAALLESIEPGGFRVARPLRASSGALLVDGWVASTFLEGRHEPRWAEVIAAGEVFHAAVARIPRPTFLDRRSSPWVEGDRVAWEEAPPPAREDPLLARLLAARRPLGSPSQLIHGDLTENVLFAPHLPPAVIDLAPYWRPPAFASAVVVADALVWHGAGASILGSIAHVKHFGQFLVRALIYRLVTDRLFHPGQSIPPAEADPHVNAVDLACRLTARDC